LEFLNWTYLIGNDRIKLHYIYNKSCLCLTAKMTQSKTMRTRLKDITPPGPVDGGTRGLVGIRPNHLLAATLYLFRQRGGVDYAHHIGMFQWNFNPFRRAWLSGYATVFCVRIYLLIMSGKPAPPPKKVKQNFLHCWST